VGVEALAVPPMKRWLDAIATYRDRRMIIILLLGFSSGFPLMVTLSTLSYWLAKLGINVKTIGLISLVQIPYNFKFLWSPILDQIPPPFLGRRRGWALIIQFLMALAILGLGMTDPLVSLWMTVTMSVLVAFLSASQDIVLDAYRIELLPQTDSEQSASSSAYQLGYRFGMLAAGAGAIALADFVSWRAVFIYLTALSLVGMVTILLAHEHQEARAPKREAFAIWIERAVIKPLLEFTTRRGWVVILLFVLLYKLGAAVGTSVISKFYVDLAFTGVEIASITKVMGPIAFMLGIVAGGMIAVRFGVMRSLLLGGILQAFGILMFAVLAAKGHDLIWLGIAIGAENAVDGISSAAFVAYLSALTNIAFTATQYALLSSLTAFGRTFFASGGGWLVEHLGWVLFYVTSATLAIPGLILLIWLMRLYPTEKSIHAQSAA